MLKKRSRAGNQSNLPWLPPEKPTKPISFFFNAPRIFKGFLTISSSSSSSSSSTETEPIMSPTSIFDTQPFSSIANSFWVDSKIPPTKTPKTLSENTHSWEQPNNTKGIGVALVDEISEPSNPSTKQQQQQKRKLVVFGSQLSIQVPPLPPSFVFPCFSPESPREFGIKTPRSRLRLFGNRDCQVPPEETSLDGEIVRENISVSDMEESEDYTCVISHGPNPKTTHIFGNYIVESCCGDDGSSSSSSFSSKRNGYLSSLENSVPSQESFLSFCHHCKKKLGQGKNIYMYRGEKAFCSQECRCQEMLCDGVES